MITTSIFAYLLAVGVLVVFHEFGHYLVARLCGIKVLRFSVGFGPILYSRRVGRDQTEWALSAIPLGGYVKMLDEREEEVAPQELSRAFNRKPVWQRMAVVAAGPAFNLLLAVALYFAIFAHGVMGTPPEIGEVTQGSAAERAQFKSGETVLSVDGKAVPSWQEFRWKLLSPSMRHDRVEVVTRDADGREHTRILDLSEITPSDMKNDFVRKLGLNVQVPPYKPVVGLVVANSAAEEAGLKDGDILLSADGQPLTGWDQWVSLVQSHAGQTLTLEVRREEGERTIRITPRAVQEDGKTIGKVGVGASPDMGSETQIPVEYSLPEALWLGVEKTWDIGELSLRMLGKMVMGEASLRNLSGPIKTAEVAGQTVQLGLLPFIFFIAFVSVGVGVLNILPVPVLDGGHLMYYTVEFVMGRPVSERAWEMGQRVGAAVLFSLMLLVIYNDISSYF